jgi:hypothetical protein
VGRAIVPGPEGDSVVLHAVSFPDSIDEWAVAAVADEVTRSYQGQGHDLVLVAVPANKGATALSVIETALRFEAQR